MNKLFILILIFLGLSANLLGQKNVLVEFKYLELINAQSDAKLCNDNYRNSELISDSIIFNKYLATINSHFYLELARSYAINNENAMVAFSILRQQCIAPNNGFDKEALRMFEEASLRLNITHKTASKIFESCNHIGKSKASFMQKLSSLYDNSILLFNDEIDDKLMHYFSFYNTNNNYVTFSQYQWEYFNRINLGIKKKQKILIASNKASETKNYWKVDDLKLQKRVIMRSEHYYRKSGAKAEAKLFIEEYRKLDIGFFNKFQAGWRSMLN